MARKNDIDPVTYKDISQYPEYKTLDKVLDCASCNEHGCPCKKKVPKSLYDCNKYSKNINTALIAMTTIFVIIAAIFTITKFPVFNSSGSLLTFWIVMIALVFTLMIAVEVIKIFIKKRYIRQEEKRRADYDEAKAKVEKDFEDRVKEEEKKNKDILAAKRLVAKFKALKPQFKYMHDFAADDIDVTVSEKYEEFCTVLSEVTDMLRQEVFGNDRVSHFYHIYLTEFYSVVNDYVTDERYDVMKDEDKQKMVSGFEVLLGKTKEIGDAVKNEDQSELMIKLDTILSIFENGNEK